MAKIPVPSAASAVIAQPRHDAFSPAGAFDGSGAQGLAAVGDALMGAASTIDRVQRHQQQQTLELNRATAASALVDYEYQTKSLATSVAARVSSGDLRWSDATQAYADASKMIEAPAVDNADPLTRLSLGKGTMRHDEDAKAIVDRAVMAGQKIDRRTQVDSALDIFGKLAGVPGADVAKINAQLDAFDGLGAATYGGAWGKVKQDAKDKNWTNEAIGRVNLNRDNLDGLNATIADLTTGKYVGLLDTDRRNAVIQQATGYRNQLQTRADHAQDRREAAAEREVNAVEAIVSSGDLVDPNRIVLAQQITRGTAQAGVIDDLMAQQQALQKVLALPPAQQQEYVNRLQAEQQAKGTFDARERAIVNRMSAAVEKNIAMLHEDPLSFQAKRTGAPVQPLDLSQAQSPDGIQAIAANLGQRMVTLTAMQKQYGPEVPLAPLTKGEALGLTSLVEKLPDVSKLALFAGLSKALPPDAFVGTMGQLKADSTTIAAGVAAGRELRTPDGWGVGETLLAGRAILKDKSAVMPKFKGTEGDALLPEFKRMAGEAIPAGTAEREPHVQNFRAAYAAIAQREGRLDGRLDTSIAQRAFDVATGGVAEWGGKKVLKPYGMDDDVFHDTVDAAMRLAAPTTPGFAYADLRSLPLQKVGENHYAVIAGKKFIPTSDGRPLIIEVAPGAPRAPSRRFSLGETTTELRRAVGQVNANAPVDPGAVVGD